MIACHNGGGLAESKALPLKNAHVTSSQDKQKDKHPIVAHTLSPSHFARSSSSDEAAVLIIHETGCEAGLNPPRLTAAL